MIRHPRRSVTRFFIPLLDVFILLFCIFLLMPYVKPVEGEAGAVTPKPGDAAELKGEIDALRRERDRLKRERSQVLDRLVIRVLEIDRNSGKLFDYDPERVEIATASAAQDLIERQRQASIGRDVYFLFLFPRESSGYPLERQMTAYSDWFKDVPHGFDDPRGKR
jgi:hypothetical protein